MSALPPKADIAKRYRHVRFVPKADILRCGKERRYSTTSLANLTICGSLAGKTTRSGQRQPKIMRQHAERLRDDENGYWQR